MRARLLSKAGAAHRRSPHSGGGSGAAPIPARAVGVPANAAAPTAPRVNGRAAGFGESTAVPVSPDAFSLSQG